MRKLLLSLAAVLTAASFAVAAQEPAPAPAAKPADQAEAKPAAKAKTHRVEAEIVSADVDKKTVTFKVEGAEKTAPVGPLAMYRLKKVKAGDKVVLTCKDTEAGDHQEVSFIRMATPEAKPAEAPAAEKKN